MQRRNHPRRMATAVAAAIGLVGPLCFSGAGPTSAAPTPSVSGAVVADGPSRAWDVRAWITGTDSSPVRSAGVARSDRSGRFTLRHEFSFYRFTMLSISGLMTLFFTWMLFRVLKT